MCKKHFKIQQSTIHCTYHEISRVRQRRKFAGKFQGKRTGWQWDKNIKGEKPRGTREKWAADKIRNIIMRIKCTKPSSE